LPSWTLTRAPERFWLLLQSSRGPNNWTLQSGSKILWHARCRSTVNSGNVVYNRC
jgi:hypothetical protein